MTDLEKSTHATEVLQSGSQTHSSLSEKGENPLSPVVDLELFSETRGYTTDENVLKQRLGLEPGAVLKKDIRGRVLIPQPSDDPRDPLNWSPWRKRSIFIMLAIASFTADYSAATGASAMLVQAEQWHLSPDTINHATAGNTFMLGVGGLLTVWFFAFFGRLPVMVVFMLLSAATAIWSAAAQSFESYMASRILNGLFAISAASGGLALINDIYFFHERPQMITIWATCIIMSPFLGPQLMSAILQHHSWRVGMWLNAALIIFGLLAVITLGEETFYPRHRSPSLIPDIYSEPRSSRLVGISQFRSRYTGNGFMESASRLARTPTRIVVLVTGVFYFLDFGYTIANNTLMAVLVVPAYRFTYYDLATVYIAPVVGALLQLPIGILLFHICGKLWARYNGGIIEPEARLLPLWIILPFKVAGFMMIGTTIQNHLNIWILAVGWAMHNCTTILTTAAGSAYLIDAYPEASGESAAWLNFARTLSGFIMGYIELNWVAETGVEKTYGAQAGIMAGAFLVFIVPLTFLGRRVRQTQGPLKFKTNRGDGAAGRNLPPKIQVTCKPRQLGTRHALHQHATLNTVSSLAIGKSKLGLPQRSIFGLSLRRFSNAAPSTYNWHDVPSTNISGQIRLLQRSGQGSLKDRDRTIYQTVILRPSRGIHSTSKHAKKDDGPGPRPKEVKEPESSGEHFYDRLHIPNFHRPTKEELLAAATGFWSRLKVRFKWITIREARPFNMDEIVGFFSWIAIGHLVWLIVGTTTFISLAILGINTVFAQETLAGWIGNYLTKSSGVQVVFESAIVPKWSDGVITFKNVFVSRRPGGQAQSIVKKGTADDAAQLAARAEIPAEDQNYTQFDVTLGEVNVTLSFNKWWNSKGPLQNVEIKHVRGVVDRTHVFWGDDYGDPKNYRHEHNPGDFEIESFKIENLLLTLHQPKGFRPFTVSIYNADLPRLRKQWLMYDFLNANNISGEYDGSLFTIHPRQTHSYTGLNLSEIDANDPWKKQSRIRIDGLNIDHLNRGVEGPFSWIHEGNVDIVSDIMIPDDDDKSVIKVMSDFYDQVEAQFLIKKRHLQHLLENNIEAGQVEDDGEVNPPLPATILDPSPDSDRRYLVMDLRIHLNDVRAVVPIFTKDLSYVNNALIRPIVAYINSRRTFIPIHCRVVKRISDFDGSWTIYDSGLMDDLSAETYDAFSRDVSDEQARMRRIKKVGLWSLQVAVQAIFLGMAGTVI